MALYKSYCCDADVIMVNGIADFAGDGPMHMRTCYAVCRKCEKPCNFYVKHMRRPKKNKMMEEPCEAK